MTALLETLIHLGNVVETLDSFKRQYQAGAITKEQYEASLRELQSRDAARVAELRRGSGRN